MLPPNLQTEFALQATVLCGSAIGLDLGNRGKRKFIPIEGGSFHGPGLHGTVLAGGGDWQIERGDGVLEIEARYNLQTHDGALIGVRNRGLSVRAPTVYVRTCLEFEAPPGAYAWLNCAIFVGTLQVIQRAPLTVLVNAFKVT
jgi:hypothetical protein